MNDLIHKADAIAILSQLEKDIRQYSPLGHGGNAILLRVKKIKENISNMAPADAIEVIRCKNCGHMEESGRCYMHDIEMKRTDYCSYAEKKGDANE